MAEEYVEVDNDEVKVIGSPKTPNKEANTNSCSSVTTTIEECMEKGLRLLLPTQDADWAGVPQDVAQSVPNWQNLV